MNVLHVTFSLIKMQAPSILVNVLFLEDTEYIIQIQRQTKKLLLLCPKNHTQNFYWAGHPSLYKISQESG